MKDALARVSCVESQSGEVCLVMMAFRWGVITRSICFLFFGGISLMMMMNVDNVLPSARAFGAAEGYEGCVYITDVFFC